MKFEDKDKIVYCCDELTSNKLYLIKGGLYYKSRLVHRENGPAIEWKNGDKFWFLNGKQYTEKEHYKIINDLKNKNKILDDI
jgi:hypothetical protein